MGLNLGRLAPAVAARAGPFLADLEHVSAGSLHSLHVVGSAVVSDWDERLSDINSLLLLRRMDLAVLEAIAPLGARYGGKGIAAPLVMGTDFVHRSLDVFPMEFLDLRLIHVTVLGDDLLSGLPISRGDLRRQCEREVKSRLVGLRQGFLGARDDRKLLRGTLVRYLVGCAPLARGILFLLGQDQPREKGAAFEALASAAGPDVGVFTDLLALRSGRAEPDLVELRGLFERCHGATERLGRILDDLAP